MNKTELEFQINDAFDTVLHCRASLKVLLFTDLMLWAVIFHAMFGRLFEILTICAVCIALGWSFAEQS